MADLFPDAQTSFKSKLQSAGSLCPTPSSSMGQKMNSIALVNAESGFWKRGVLALPPTSRHNK